MVTSPRISNINSIIVTECLTAFLATVGANNLYQYIIIHRRYSIVCRFIGFSRSSNSKHYFGFEEFGNIIRLLFVSVTGVGFNIVYSPAM